MSKSLEYIKRRIEEGNCKNMSQEEFTNMNVAPLNSLCDKLSVGETIVLAITKDEDRVIADLTYNPDADFDYFTTENCVCDGTLVFMNELMAKILKKIESLNTCYSPVLEGLTPEDIVNYIIHYEVGDFVTNSHIIEPPDKDKPWMCDRFTVMLPIKFTIEKRGKEE